MKFGLMAFCRAVLTRPGKPPAALTAGFFHPGGENREF
jgi:hypothetical protein